jgi:hypothetical protein
MTPVPRSCRVRATPPTGSLQLVLSVLQRAENSVAVQLQLRAKRVDELPERLLVARAGAGARVLSQHRGPL